ncbi:hypothetical protein Goshw_027809, partial [Gossypium schwendimanii]|nr:hypothetical protein [Gossypium schwendimanii]
MAQSNSNEQNVELNRTSLYWGLLLIFTDAILNQQGQNVICVYVAIGQKVSFVAQVVTTFQERGAMEYTIV